MDGTRRNVAEQLDTRADEVATQARRAAREVAEHRAALARADRDYASGTLGAESYERFSAKFGDELAAAEAEQERLAAHANEITATRQDLDADHAMLACLEHLRAAVSARMATAAATDVGALRAAWASIFDAVRLSYKDGEVFLVPHIRDDMLVIDEADAGDLNLRPSRIPLQFGCGEVDQHPGAGPDHDIDGVKGPDE
ncbi:MAG TPA: hypothetical protein VNO82_23050 [Solirubrobacteraceae bacterium]|nr:hypothetical protein [Solirubrobacteraceae bacterium]